jgi:predicted nucleic acid-binding protein
MATSKPVVPRVFLDSSVVFAAAYSATGSARDLVLAAVQGRVGLVLSSYVIEETERNLWRRAPHAHPSFLVIRDSVPYQLSEPPDALITEMAGVVAAKDAPIIAAAQAAGVTLVATYDRRDLLSNRQVILERFGITVATPDQVLALIGETHDGP